MLYTFNITTTESKIISKTLNLDDDMKINDLKEKLVGPIISTVGFDKVKFFQTGKQFSDDNTVSEFNESERILIFPMIPSIRTILISSFEDDESSDDESQKEEKQQSPIVDDEEEPVLELKSKEEVLGEIKETLELFSKPSVIALLQIYQKNKDEFIQFIDYISKGIYNEVNPDFKMEYPDEIFDKIRETFDSFSKMSNEQIKQELDKYGGNLDILISYKFN